MCGGADVSFHARRPSRRQKTGGFEAGVGKRKSADALRTVFRSSHPNSLLADRGRPHLMLSVILYGRNDSYGYNLHKRAAISLNCIAEVLTAPGDEIIFVDYNTPDDFPTFPEAIQDTMTERAKRLLRILRVRPGQHERFRHRTELVALEPIARNVGIRRSNPGNRWILSTNTDMIFVPRRGESLSEIVATLPDAYYHLPRFEVPEPLWESLPRLDPVGTIATVGAWGSAYHLNEIVVARYPVIRYDGPGDFQLMLRSDMWRLGGFNESMLLGWHVDSNMAKRLALLPRRIGDVVDEVFGYHCDHTRQVTAAHRHRGRHNDLQVFFEDVVSATVPEQAATWGLADDSIEELKVDTTSRLYLEGLRSAIPFPLVELTELRFTDKIGERVDYSADHVMPFLAGAFASYQRDTVLGWFGVKKSLLWRFASMWKVMGFFEQIMVCREARWLGPDLPPSCTWATEEALNERCQVFTFDFGMPEGDYAAQGFELDAMIDVVADCFLRMVELERIRLARHPGSPRHFVGVNTIVRDDVRELFGDHVAAATTPTATRIKQGPVSVHRPQDVVLFDEFDCLPMLLVGVAGAHGRAPGKTDRHAIHAKLGTAGIVVYGPYITLLPGHYEAAFEFYAERAERGAKLRVDVAADRGKRILAQRSVTPHEELGRFDRALKARQGPLTCVLSFDVSAQAEQGGGQAIEFRVWSPGTFGFCLVALRLRQVVAFAQNPEGTAARSQ